MRIPGMRNLGLLELGKRSVKAYLKDDMMTYAAALAFRTLFALFPFINSMGQEDILTTG